MNTPFMQVCEKYLANGKIIFGGILGVLCDQWWTVCTCVAPMSGELRARVWLRWVNCVHVCGSDEWWTACTYVAPMSELRARMWLRWVVNCVHVCGSDEWWTACTCVAPISGELRARVWLGSEVNCLYMSLPVSLNSSSTKIQDWVDLTFGYFNITK